MAAAYDPTAPLTPAQIAANATSQVNAEIDPAVQAQKTAQQEYDAQQLAYQGSITGFTKALAGIVGGEAPAVSGAYNDAASQQAKFAQGFSTGMQHLMGQQQTQGDNMLSLGGQSQAIPQANTHLNPGGAATDPWYAIHGEIPASTLAAQGAANATRAAAQPRIFAAQGRDLLLEAVNKASAGDKVFQQKISDLWAQAPALRTKILATIQQTELSKRQTRDNEKALGIKASTAASENKTRAQSLNLRAQALNIQIQKINAQLQNSALDRQSRMKLETMRERAAAERASLHAQSGSGGGLESIGNNIITKADWYSKNPIQSGSGFSKTSKARPSLAVFNALWSTYGTAYVNGFPSSGKGAAKAQVRQAILQAMSAAGFANPFAKAKGKTVAPGKRPR